MSHPSQPFIRPSPLEYVELFRPGLGTESVAPFLRAMVQMLRPLRVLEIGAGYTTPFLLEALVNNQHVLNDGNLNNDYIKNCVYDPKLVVIDDMSLGELKDKPGMQPIIDSEYVDFVEGRFEGKASDLKKEYGEFDFVWFDCGDTPEYQAFFSEFWDICCGYVICHFTYSDGKPNANLHAILSEIDTEVFKIDLVEPHKRRQGSVTILKKR